MPHLPPSDPPPVAALDYSFPAQRGRPGIITAMGVTAISAGMGALVARAYPVALIFVLRSRAVRNYYSALRD